MPDRSAHILGSTLLTTIRYSFLPPGRRKMVRFSERPLYGAKMAKAQDRPSRRGWPVDSAHDLTSDQSQMRTRPNTHSGRGKSG